MKTGKIVYQEENLSYGQKCFIEKVLEIISQGEFFTDIVKEVRKICVGTKLLVRFNGVSERINIAPIETRNDFVIIMVK